MNRLKEIRESKHLTQEELAEKAGLNYRTIGRLEVGKHQAHRSVIRVLAMALDVHPDDLELDKLEVK